jgi:hypothetical protein
MRQLFMVILALTTAACATQKEQRSAARVLALHTQAVQTDLQKFADKRALAHIARQRSINTLEESRLRRENLNDEKVRAWQISDPARLALFRGVIAATDAAAARAAEAETQIRANETALASMKSQVLTRQDQLKRTSKTLAALSERDKLKVQLQFYRSFWQDVQKSIESAAGAAEEAATAAAQAPGGAQ